MIVEGALEIAAVEKAVVAVHKFEEVKSSQGCLGGLRIPFAAERNRESQPFRSSSAWKGSHREHQPTYICAWALPQSWTLVSMSHSARSIPSAADTACLFCRFLCLMFS